MKHFALILLLYLGLSSNTGCGESRDNTVTITEYGMYSCRITKVTLAKHSVVEGVINYKGIPLKVDNGHRWGRVEFNLFPGENITAFFAIMTIKDTITGQIIERIVSDLDVSAYKKR